MTPILVLLGLVLLDGMFSGVRAGFGRTGLIRHRARDLRAGGRGVLILLAVAVPAAVVVVADLGWRGGEVAHYRDAANGALTVVGPYAAAVLVAFAVYFGLGWRRRYVAMALVLGPFTLLRPLVAVAGAGVAGLCGADTSVSLAVLLGTAAVLAVEPLVGRRFRVSAASVPARSDPARRPGRRHRTRARRRR